MNKSILSSFLETGCILLILILLVFCSSMSAENRRQHEHIEIELEEPIEDEPEETEEEEPEEEPLVFEIDPNDPLPVSTFNEVWGYVLAGRESDLRRGMPVTDVGYFAADVNIYGQLSNIPRRQNLNFQGRVHLVVVCGNYALTHFVLAPGSEVRRRLIADLIAASRDFDGLQLDFENIPARDGANYLSFIRELREGLPEDKMFTICLYARTRRLANDVYDYQNIAPYVDRIFVMAYDEHWGGSSPGPVSSLNWARRVAAYSLQAVGPEKLIMGIPFYGRAWGNHNPSRALIWSTVDRIIRENNAQVRRENGIPTFNYSVNVQVQVYFEDHQSLATRMDMFKNMGVRAIGFWRIGQETPDVWRYLRLGD